LCFIDEIHTLVGAGGGEGAMDAANILNPALARGELHTATTWTNTKNISKKKALERRFQKTSSKNPIPKVPSLFYVESKKKYETHKVQIKDEAISSCGVIRTLYHKSFSTR
jgi:ATP-dependent Clp protease ATP-binding subunit ClpB